MSKQWYYEVMGSPVGPITSAELKACVQTRRIQPETRIRLGDDGKWQTADRVKGLFDATPSAVRPQAPTKPKSDEIVLVAPVVKSTTTASETGTVELSTLQTAEMKIQVAAVTPAVAAAAVEVKAEEDADVEYDFFKFVGFEIAIGHALNNALKEYCRVNHVTMTQTTRRALAEFLGRKDLAGDKAAAVVPTTPEVFGVG